MNYTAVPLSGEDKHLFMIFFCTRNNGSLLFRDHARAVHKGQSSRLLRQLLLTCISNRIGTA